MKLHVGGEKQDEITPKNNKMKQFLQPITYPHFHFEYYMGLRHEDDTIKNTLGSSLSRW